MICCPWAYGSSLKQLYPRYLGQILGFWLTCGVKMMSLRHCWGWQPYQTASPIHIRHIQSVWEHQYCPWAYGSSLKQFYPHYLGQILGFWLTCGVKMMSLCHGWGWQPPQTASRIHIRHIQCVWAHWYAVHGNMSVASNSYTYTTWLRFWGSGSLAESKWYHYIMVVADSHIKLLPTSMIDIYKVFKHIGMLSMGIWQ